MDSLIMTLGPSPVDSTLTLASQSLNGEKGNLCLPTTFTISARF
jgi:hypothetical protein